jgi:hypothetical protein
MSDRWLPFGIITVVVLILALAAYTNLEVYAKTTEAPPSRQVRGNSFFALEKWLARTGLPTRTIRQGNAARIISAPEKTVYVQSNVFDWEGAVEPLKQWMEAGGHLLFSVWDFETPDLISFLGSFGVSAFPSDDVGPEDNGGAFADSPDFNRYLEFKVSKETGVSAFIIREKYNPQIIRLVQIPQGAGALSIIGRPQFMENDYLEREVNARLAWDLTGARAGEGGRVLFIRGRLPTKSLFGQLADRGNFFPLTVAGLILIVVGFWMVIPIFGLVFQERTSPGRPIGERFLAEIRFLKKYRALKMYPEVYLGEIKRKLRGREAPPELAAIEQALRKKGALSYSETVRFLHILRTTLECL